MQTLAADVQSLRKGLDMTKAEKEKQPNNFIIYVSFDILLLNVLKVIVYYEKWVLIHLQSCCIKPCNTVFPRFSAAGLLQIFEVFRGAFTKTCWNAHLTVFFSAIFTDDVK